MSGGRRPSSGLLPHVGRTPLIELRPERPLPSGVRLLAKLESVNPGGSIKDRPASRIVTRALVEGRFQASDLQALLEDIGRILTVVESVEGMAS